jgi:predicted alpha/beta-fold hydrolase
MTDMRPGATDMLHKLLTELISKQDTWSNNNNRLTLCSTMQSICDHDVSLTTASGDNHLPTIVLLHGIEGALLVGAELHGMRFFDSYSIA